MLVLLLVLFPALVRLSGVWTTVYEANEDCDPENWIFSKLVGYSNTCIDASGSICPTHCFVDGSCDPASGDFKLSGYALTSCEGKALWTKTLPYYPHCTLVQGRVLNDDVEYDVKGACEDHQRGDNSAHFHFYRNDSKSCNGTFGDYYDLFVRTDRCNEMDDFLRSELTPLLTGPSWAVSSVDSFKVECNRPGTSVVLYTYSDDECEDDLGSVVLLKNACQPMSDSGGVKYYGSLWELCS